MSGVVITHLSIKLCWFVKNVKIMLILALNLQNVLLFSYDKIAMAANILVGFGLVYCM